MNHTRDHSWESQLDRLVDGELSGAEYRELLGELEREPSGWRQCALAFLEAQALRGDLRRLRESVVNVRSEAGEGAVRQAASQDSTHAPSPSVVPPASTTAAAHRMSSVAYWLTLAASWLVVFGLGVGTSRWTRESTVGPAPLPSGSAAGIARSTGSSWGHPQPLAGQERAPLYAEVSLPTMGGQKMKVASLPITNSGDEPQMLSEVPQNLPTSTVEILRKRGFGVQPGQRYVYPFTTPDGTQMVVPVDSYHLVPQRWTN